MPKIDKSKIFNHNKEEDDLDLEEYIDGVTENCLEEFNFEGMDDEVEI